MVQSGGVKQYGCSSCLGPMSSDRRERMFPLSEDSNASIIYTGDGDSSDGCEVNGRCDTWLLPMS